MGEYISREEVLSRIYATHSTGGFANEEAYLWLHDAITNLSADVQPVKHGRWIKVIGENYECSNCKAALWVRKVNPISNYKYCWSCGYKMDGDDDGKD